MTLLQFQIIILVVTVTWLIRAELHNFRRLVYIFKPISTLLVIGVVLPELFQTLPVSMYTKLIFFGLLFSLGGDLALMFPENRKAFPLGLALFLIAHLFYISAFLVLGELVTTDIFWLFLMAIPGLLLYRLMQANLGALKAPVIAYIMIISIMVASALTFSGSEFVGSRRIFLIISGAGLFYISDLILALNRFWKPWKYSRISLAFYYAGQLFIALSAV